MFRYLADAQMLDLDEVHYLRLQGVVVHGKNVRQKADRRPSRLVSSLSVSMGLKGPFPGPFQEYLILYHTDCVIRHDEDDLLWPFWKGYLVLYHLFPSPCLHIGLSAGKVSGVLFDPVVLGGLLPLFFTLGSEAYLLSLAHPVIGGKVPSADETSLDHHHTPYVFVMVNDGGQNLKKQTFLFGGVWYGLEVRDW